MLLSKPTGQFFLGNGLAFAQGLSVFPHVQMAEQMTPQVHRAAALPHKDGHQSGPSTSEHRPGAQNAGGRRTWKGWQDAFKESFPGTAGGEVIGRTPSVSWPHTERVGELEAAASDGLM